MLIDITEHEQTEKFQAFSIFILKAHDFQRFWLPPDTQTRRNSLTWPREASKACRIFRMRLPKCPVSSIVIPSPTSAVARMNTGVDQKIALLLKMEPGLKSAQRKKLKWVNLAHATWVGYSKNI